MTSTPRTTEKNYMAFEALQSMEQKPTVSFLPVIHSEEAGSLVGLVTLHDLVSAGL